jgi:hypothetical protein
MKSDLTRAVEKILKANNSPYFSIRYTNTPCWTGRLGVHYSIDPNCKPIMPLNLIAARIAELSRGIHHAVQSNPFTISVYVGEDSGYHIVDEVAIDAGKHFLILDTLRAVRAAETRNERIVTEGLVIPKKKISGVSTEKDVVVEVQSGLESFDNAINEIKAIVKRLPVGTTVNMVIPYTQRLKINIECK